MNCELEIEDVRAALEKGERVLLMTRHAERPHIDHEDPTFGENLPITPAGAEAALDFGRRLRPCIDAIAAGLDAGRATDAMRDIQFMSSPLRRTRLTAAAIADGMGLSSAWNFDTIPTDTLIGNGSPYYADARAVWEIFRGGEFYRLSFEYCSNGRQTGFRPLETATNMLEDFVLSRFTGRLSVFASHDLFIAAFLSGRGAWSGWTEETWVRYLDSAAIFIARDGSRRYALVRSVPAPR